MSADYVFYDPKYPDGAYRKHPDAVRVIEFEWLPGVANYWEAGRQYGSSDVVRPLVPTGFAYEAGAAGQSGFRTPRWPETLGGTVVDGSITWTAVAPGANGVMPISSPTAEVEPSGELAVSNVIVIQETRVRVTLAGGEIDGGLDRVGLNQQTVRGYVVTVSITAGSEVLKGSVVVAVVPR
jgi:hypothetical protein